MHKCMNIHARAHSHKLIHTNIHTYINKHIFTQIYICQQKICIHTNTKYIGMCIHIFIYKYTLVDRINVHKIYIIYSRSNKHIDVYLYMYTYIHIDTYKVKVVPKLLQVFGGRWSVLFEGDAGLLTLTTLPFLPSYGGWYPSRQIVHVHTPGHIHLYVHSYIYIHTHIYRHKALSIFVFVFLFVAPSTIACLPACLSIRLSGCPSEYVSACLSLCKSTVAHRVS